MKEGINDKHVGKLTKKIMLLHDNAPPYTPKLRTLGLQVVIRLTNLPVLVHPDYYLFPNLKKHLKGNYFEDIQNVKEAATTFISDD